MRCGTAVDGDILVSDPMKVLESRGTFGYHMGAGRFETMTTSFDVRSVEDASVVLEYVKETKQDYCGVTRPYVVVWETVNNGKPVAHSEKCRKPHKNERLHRLEGGIAQCSLLVLLGTRRKDEDMKNVLAFTMRPPSEDTLTPDQMMRFIAVLWDGALANISRSACVVSSFFSYFMGNQMVNVLINKPLFDAMYCEDMLLTRLRRTSRRSASVNPSRFATVCEECAGDRPLVGQHYLNDMKRSIVAYDFAVDPEVLDIRCEISLYMQCITSGLVMMQLGNVDWAMSEDQAQMCRRTCNSWFGSRSHTTKVVRKAINVFGEMSAGGLHPTKLAWMNRVVFSSKMFVREAHAVDQSLCRMSPVWRSQAQFGTYTLVHFESLLLDCVANLGMGGNLRDFLISCKSMAAPTIMQDLLARAGNPKIDMPAFCDVDEYVSRIVDCALTYSEDTSVNREMVHIMRQTMFITSAIESRDAAKNIWMTPCPFTGLLHDIYITRREDVDRQRVKVGHLVANMAKHMAHVLTMKAAGAVVAQQHMGVRLAAVGTQCLFLQSRAPLAESELSAISSLMDSVFRPHLRSFRVVFGSY